ncbi:MAG TPA: SRPBCC family protein [Candidatus Thermoplasmatota archaeon]|nr:SRPBCC family protein [Candidatus Thermoplasmatota archaeon]
MTIAQPKPLRLERTFDATPQEMWEAWTDPTHYAKWLNPSGIDLVIHEWDLREGGRMRFDMPQPDGNKNPQEGVFHLLRPYSHLVSGSEDKSFLLDVRIEPVGKARCRLLVEITGVPPDWHEAAMVGWGQCLVNLDVELARSTPIGGQSWSLERVLDATPEDVWTAFTDREVYKKWISPFRADAEVHEFDPRPGGRGRFTMIGENGERYPEAAFLFLKLDKPREIVMFEANRDRTDIFDGHPMQMRVTFEALPGDKTRLVLTQSGLPKDFPVEVARQGFGACLDKLERVLA